MKFDREQTLVMRLFLPCVMGVMVLMTAALTVEVTAEVTVELCGDPVIVCMESLELPRSSEDGTQPAEREHWKYTIQVIHKISRDFSEMTSDQDVVALTSQGYTDL